MSTLKQLITAQKQLFEETRVDFKKIKDKAPDHTVAIELKEKTLAHLETRVKGLKNEKKEAVDRLDQQIDEYASQISILKKQIEQEKKDSSPRDKAKKQTKRTKKKSVKKQSPRG